MDVDQFVLEAGESAGVGSEVCVWVVRPRPEEVFLCFVLVGIGDGLPTTEVVNHRVDGLVVEVEVLDVKDLGVLRTKCY